MDTETFAVRVLIWATAAGGVAIIRAVIKANNEKSQAVVAYEQTLEAARVWVDQRATGMLHEFPEWDDRAIAQAIWDELLNHHVTERAYFQWANADTVARARRTIQLAQLRASRTT